MLGEGHNRKLGRDITESSGTKLGKQYATDVVASESLTDNVHEEDRNLGKRWGGMAGAH